jgi:Zn-dependent membrane protease YugP
MFFFHPILDPLIFAAFGLTIWAQFKVKGTFNRYSEVPTSTGLTGFQAARYLLDANGLHDVPIEPVPGRLTDHYDPIQRVVRLSEPVYYEKSIAAVSVACHEVGHAIQHKVNYPMLVARHHIFPVVNLTSSIAPWLIMAGLLFQQNTTLLGLGIIFFSFAVLFQVITLPVEFNASSRAKQLMLAQGYISNEEAQGVSKVLGAAALTYVAAALISVLELIKYIMIFTGRRDE